MGWQASKDILIDRNKIKTSEPIIVLNYSETHIHTFCIISLHVVNACYKII